MIPEEPMTPAGPTQTPHHRKRHRPAGRLVDAIDSDSTPSLARILDEIAADQDAFSLPASRTDSRKVSPVGHWQAVLPRDTVTLAAERPEQAVKRPGSFELPPRTCGRGG